MEDDAFGVLLKAYDTWVKQSSDDVSPQDAKLALSALRSAALEIKLKGKRLSSVPLLLQLAASSSHDDERRRESSLCNELPRFKGLEDR